MPVDVPALATTTTARRYPPVGRCIYCGDEGSDGPLGDEHIVPYGLGGRLILGQASCRACGDETGAVEGHCLGRMFGAARTHLGIRSRHRKPKRDLPIEVDDGNGPTTLYLPIASHPAIITMFSFLPPGILAGLDPREGCAGLTVIRPMTADIGERLSRLRGSVNLVKGPVEAVKLIRMLAKIAHSYAVAELGIDGFVPFLAGLILGHEPMYPEHFVGTDFESDPAGRELHELSIDFQNGLAVVRVRLFAPLDMPTYRVVVGKCKT